MWTWPRPQPLADGAGFGLVGAGRFVPYCGGGHGLFGAVGADGGGLGTAIGCWGWPVRCWPLSDLTDRSGGGVRQRGGFLVLLALIAAAAGRTLHRPV